MIALHNLLPQLPKVFKRFIALFVIILSVGFFSGISFVNHNTSFSPTGIKESYLGNESNPSAKEMKFKKSEQQMLTMLHNHILSMSVIFFMVGSLTLMTKAPKHLKQFFAFEPLFSIVFTFGGLYLLWNGVLWMKYIVILSGILMCICYSGCIVLIAASLAKKATLQSNIAQP